MKKLLTALLGITLVLTMLTGGTFAYLNAEAENMDNTISSGTMCLGTDPEPFMQLTDMMPGGPVQQASVSVFTGTPTKFFYKVSAVRQTGTSTKLWNAVKLEVEDSITGEIWSGNLNAMETGWFARESGVPGGGPDNARLVNFRVWIPQEADIDDETTATVKFTFDAEQWRPVTP